MKFTGTVVHGDGYGRKLGYPTVNIDSTDYLKKGLNLKDGVYIGEVELLTRQEKYPAAIVVSKLPDKNEIKLEAHLLNFSGDLYGEEVSFFIIEFIRPYHTYVSTQELKEAIADDIVRTKQFFAQLNINI
jgi:FAD synthase